MTPQPRSRPRATVAPAPHAPAPSDGLSPRDYQRVSALIRDAIGLQLGPDKRITVEGRLRKRARTLGLPGLREYCRHLLDEGGLAGEMAGLIDALTTNKTDFFREADHFDLLRRRIVPDLLSHRRGARPKLKVWSAAASTGAEAYTVAMVLADMVSQGASFDFAVLGTDVSGEVLETARLGVYPAEFLAPTPQPLRRFLMTARSPRMRGKLRIAPELRARTRFAELNLMDARYPVDDDVDVAFLRNVLIYFNRDDQMAVIRKVLAHLRPGGYLLLGHAETMVGGFAARAVAPAVFQKELHP
ncbi:MAG: CheR family methyltransferase [Rubrimonas sp.]|uniref:CheR family methyltransferase n=1 Tax=Rubrimonas sp. TaxID=2036015 RepID=UPI002FDCF309